MHDHIPMAILHPRYDLLKEMPRLVFPQSSLLHDVIEQLARLHVLHHQKDVVRRLQYLVQPNDVRMHEQPQNLNLPSHLFLHVDRLDLLPIQNLDRHLVSRQHVFRHFHLPERPDPERLPDAIVRQVNLRLPSRPPPARVRPAVLPALHRARVARPVDARFRVASSSVALARRLRVLARRRRARRSRVVGSVRENTITAPFRDARGSARGSATRARVDARRAFAPRVVARALARPRVRRGVADSRAPTVRVVRDES